MSKPRIGIIIGSVRNGRFADKMVAWLTTITAQRQDMEFEILDLKDFAMPFFDDAMPPAMGKPAGNEAANRWRARLAPLDGFIFVTAEYTRGPTAALKNALDWAYLEWNRKPAAYVAYGSTGGARAVEQLRTNMIELQMAPVRHAVHLGGSDFMATWLEGKPIEDFPYYVQNANDMLDNLAWWARALKTARGAA